MSREPVVIVGAGLAGLAAGHALAREGRDYLILEAGDRPGGLCRTEERQGYAFDYTGHLLHLREGDSRAFIMDLVGDQLAEHTRRASIYVAETLVPYPIQAHFGALPGPLARRCREDLAAVSGEDGAPEDLSFDGWAVNRFGPTLAGLFMIPYNAKLNVYPLEEMEVSWTSWSVPRPSLEEIDRITRGEEPPAFGYNATFFYPRRGGIEVLVQALARGQERSLRLGKRVTGVNAEGRWLTLEDGGRVTYSSLISTMPLPELLTMTTGLPGDPARAAAPLRHSSVLGVCVGLDRPPLIRDHWVYFPEDDLPFYRVGFPTNFSEAVAPPGCGSLYAETAFRPGEAPDPDRVAGEVLEVLKTAGILDRETRVTARVDIPIPWAYVFHDRYRARNLPSLHDALGKAGIRSVGRYGAWEYSAMQDAVEQGLAAAGEVLP